MNPNATSPHALAALVRRVVAADTAAIYTAPRAMLTQPALLSGLTRRGWFAARVDRAPVFNKETVLHAFYQAGCFPAYFGFNWDALADVLADLSWLRAQERPAEGCVFILAHIQVLAQRAPDVHTVLVDLIRDVAATRRAAGLPPLVLLLEQAAATPQSE